jgi:hypothetical protein
MIHYQLRCGQGHEFDGWFKDSASFDKQAQKGLLECPECGAREIARALMAPAVPRERTAQPAPPSPGLPAPPQQKAATGPMPAQLQAMLQRMRSVIERNCDYVGPEFAEEARRIHRGESEKRGIYGEATPAEAESLADEGIEIARVPWVPRADG